VSYEPRTIAFLAEIIHQPRQPAPPKLQAVHNRLFQQPEIAYQNFQVAADGVHLTNPATRPGEVSSASFLADRLVLREEFRPGTVEDFATRVVNVASIGFAETEVATCLARQFVVRSLVSPRSSNDSRTFVAERLLAGGASALQAFGRPLQTVGLRFAFPPSPPRDGESANAAQGSFHVRVEPWVQEPRSLWLEVAGSYTQPTSTSALPSLSDGIWATYHFLTGPVLEWLARVDEPDSRS
jgi:hypothetical protein